MKRVLFLLLAACAAASPCIAKESSNELSVQPDNKAAFTQISADVRNQMRPGGHYESLRPKERVQVDQGLNEMAALFDKYPTVESMNLQAKLDLFNAQEKVNSVLSLGDRDRMVCKKQVPLGSHIPVVQCHTYE